MSKHLCLSCKLAKWQRTTSGRLHPSGDGMCQWQFPETPLPPPFYWLGFSKGGCPRPYGGNIARKPDKPINFCVGHQDDAT